MSYRYRPDSLECKTLDLIAGFDRMEMDKVLGEVKSFEKEIRQEEKEKQRERGEI